MKKLTGFVVIVLIASSLFAQNKVISVTEYHYIDRQEVLDENGSLIINYDVKNNSADGVYEVYYDSKKERPYMKGAIQNGHKDGLWEYYNDLGVIIRQTEYLEGIKHGTEKVYNLKGNVIDEIPYKNGVVDGKRVQYYDTGVVKSIMEIKSGEIGEVQNFNESGVLIENKE